MIKSFYSKQAKNLKYSEEPTISASLTGITVLHQNVCKSRFSGSKVYIVDRRGNLQLKEKKCEASTTKNQSLKKKSYRVNKSRVTHLILNWINQQKSQKSLMFYTISFPSSCPDAVAYKCLNSWLTSVRQAYKLTEYLWIAERQKNGTVHFHICIEQFLPIKLVNGLMKKLLHYYIRKKELKWNHLACSKYNGIDICKDKKTHKVVNFAGSGSKRAITGYLTKYISKGSTAFTRQAWQCSKSLCKLFTKFNLTFDEFEGAFMRYIDVEKPIVDTEFYTFFSWLKFPPPEIVYQLKVTNYEALHLSLDRN